MVKIEKENQFSQMDLKATKKPIFLSQATRKPIFLNHMDQIAKTRSLIL
jgi:hypothetical protein